VVGALTPRQHLLEQRRELPRGVAGGVGRRAADRGHQRIRLCDADRRDFAEPLGVRHEPVDELVAEPAHLLGRERERFGHEPRA
jgi:hypothetical protein